MNLLLFLGFVKSSKLGFSLQKYDLVSMDVTFARIITLTFRGIWNPIKREFTNFI